MNIRIVCDDCELETSVDRDDVGDALRRHNDRQHDGDAVACVAADHVDRFAAP